MGLSYYARERSEPSKPIRVCTADWKNWSNAVTNPSKTSPIMGISEVRKAVIDCNRDWSNWIKELITSSNLSVTVALRDTIFYVNKMKTKWTSI